MALQDICRLQDVFPQSKVTEDLLVAFGQKTKHNCLSALPLRNSGSMFYFYTPVAEYLEESPIQFGQIARAPVSAVDAFLPEPTGSPFVPLPFPMSHGTTTLAFIFQGGVLAAADTRSSCSGLVACPASQKILPVHSHMVGTTSGTSADCALWKRILSRELRLYQLRHGRRLSTGGAAKLLSHMLHPFKGTELCVAATLCGWDGGAPDGCPSHSSLEHGNTRDMTSHARGQASGQETASPVTEALKSQPSSSTAELCGDKTVSGPGLYYVCSDGTRLKGALFSVGSGSPYAYSILDQEVRWGLTVDEAVSVAREAVYRATHRDAYSGNCVDVYHVTSRGWRRRSREDLKEEYYRERARQEEKVKERRERLEKPL